MSVSDKGDMQNVQSSGSRGTGLKITDLDRSQHVSARLDAQVQEKVRLA